VSFYDNEAGYSARNLDEYREIDTYSKKNSYIKP
jgi:hypothetical protein